MPTHNDEVARLNAATVLEVNAHCAVIPEPYGWVAAGSFYTDRESAICAAEKTPCIDVYSRPQMNALENRSLQRQELAEELARQLNASCAEIRNMRNLYAAPVSEAKAQGVVMPEPDIKTGHGYPAYSVAAVTELFARLNASPVQQVVPDGSTKMQWPEIVALVNEVLGCEAHKYPCERGSIGHEMTGINFNSLARIIDRVRYAAPAAPAADAGHVFYAMDGNHP